LIAAVFAVLFGLSLLPGRKPLCLRFAERISGGIMPDGAETYCRRLTWIWFAVLTALAAFSAATAFYIAPNVRQLGWAAYLVPAFCSAVVVPAVFLIEGVVRNRRFRFVFHTSGSTAKPKTIVKTFASLAKEVAFHRARLALVFACRPFLLATVEPGHMYGTLWRTLLTRATGCAQNPSVILEPETLLAEMRAAEAVFLVTTPSFLRRFCAYADQYDVPQNAVEIVTSGALLDAETSAAARRVFGRAPLEIFGSTETGGVASRRQSDACPDAYDWKVFDPVRVSRTADGRLCVRSPFSFRRRYVMGDGVELSPDGRRFKLLGRLDRLVKINEERVSLPEMEEKMKTLPGVREAALVALEGAHGAVLGAVIAGEARSVLEIRAACLPLFPKGTVPKRYRFVDELPRNPQGKVTGAALRSLFDGQDR